MILLWFLVGIALIFAIARYNESNKLFWTLLFSFVLGFTGTTMVLRTTGNNEQGNVNLTQVYSTQMPTKALSTLLYYTASDDSYADSVVTAHQSVSQSYTPVDSEDNITLGKVSERTRDQPRLKQLKPPELCFQKVISTHHDGS